MPRQPIRRLSRQQIVKHAQSAGLVLVKDGLRLQDGAALHEDVRVAGPDVPVDLIDEGRALRRSVVVAAHYILSPATEADAHELAPLLRAPDRAEVLALGLEPIDGLLSSLRASREAWTMRAADGRVVFMIGVCPLTLIGRTGVPWLLGSDLVLTHRRAFMVETRRLLDRAHEMFPVLRNLVDARYPQAIRWLDWLGFVIRDPQPIANGLFWIAEKEAR